MLLAARSPYAATLVWNLTPQPDSQYADSPMRDLTGCATRASLLGFGGILIDSGSSVDRSVTAGGALKVLRTAPRGEADQQNAVAHDICQQDAEYRIFKHKTPSQVAAGLDGDSSKDTGSLGVMLDVIMAPTARAAWRAAETLIEQGWPGSKAASALVGAPADVLARMAVYMSLGVGLFVLSAPLHVTTPQDIARTLLPLCNGVDVRHALSAPRHSH